SHEVKAKRIDRVTKAISLAGTRQKEVEGGSVLLPDVALYAAGHRKSKQITAR
ncbi:regulator, partial [Salmonella enterica]|nr:regulator [Salmonella enterica]